MRAVHFLNSENSVLKELALENRLIASTQAGEIMISRLFSNA